MVKNNVARRSSWKIDQDDSSRVLRFHIVCCSLKSRSIQQLVNEVAGFIDKFNLAARVVQFIWHGLPGASTLEIKKDIQKYLNGQNPESFDGKIIFMSMFNDIEWTKKGSTETCLRDAKEVAAYATQFKPELVLPGARVRKYVRERALPRSSRKMRYCRVVHG